MGLAVALCVLPVPRGRAVLGGSAGALGARSCSAMQMLARVKLTFLFSFHHAFPFINSYFSGGSAAGPVLCVGSCAAGTRAWGGHPGRRSLPERARTGKAKPCRCAHSSPPLLTGMCGTEGLQPAQPQH